MTEKISGIETGSLMQIREPVSRFFCQNSYELTVNKYSL